jgi:hypothetical protein
VDQLRFGESIISDCVNQFGPAEKISTSRSGQIQYAYTGFIVRFDGVTGKFRECTLLPRISALIGTIPVTWDRAFLRKLCEADGFPVESHGFIVLPQPGVAVTGIHDDDAAQLAVGVFGRGIWDNVLKRAKPFNTTNL